MDAFQVPLHRETLGVLAFRRECLAVGCTKSGHRPVDGPHSTENKSDKGVNFSLTPELEGVQQDRSSTVS
jgi:hypothetical protein